MTELSKTEMRDLLADVTAYIWHEADILDRRDYDSWLALWTEDGMYTMPISADSDDFDNELNLCHDNAKMRKMRIERFQRGFSISSAPPADTIRTINRIVIDEVESDVIKVRAAEHLIEDKFGRQRVWAANLEYKLVRTDDGFKIDGKIARLLNSEGMLNSFSYLF